MQGSAADMVSEVRSGLSQLLVSNVPFNRCAWQNFPNPKGGMVRTLDAYVK